MPGNGAEIYKICREAAGLTQEQAAEGLNCSVRSLARYESGEQHVPIRWWCSTTVNCWQYNTCGW